MAAVVFELTPSGCDLSTDTTPCQWVGRGGVDSRRVGASVKQTIEVAGIASADKRGAGHLRERQAWREGHGIEQQPPATCFATASAGAPNAAAALGWLFVFAEPMLRPAAAAHQRRMGTVGCRPISCLKVTPASRRQTRSSRLPISHSGSSQTRASCRPAKTSETRRTSS